MILRWVAVAHGKALRSLPGRFPASPMGMNRDGRSLPGGGAGQAPPGHRPAQPYFRATAVGIHRWNFISAPQTVEDEGTDLIAGLVDRQRVRFARPDGEGAIYLLADKRDRTIPIQLGPEDPVVHSRRDDVV
jgi:hypothetical protein